MGECYVFRKIILTLFRLVLPKRVYKAVVNRCNLSKYILTDNPDLRIFWKIVGIVFFPVRVLLLLVAALLKVFVLWIVGLEVFGNARYSFNLFVKDIASGMKFSVAAKRQKLFIELVTKGRERRVSYGDKNPDKTFYVIRPYYYLTLNELNVLHAHLLFNYYRNLQFIAYALDRGWIPVVDWGLQYGRMQHMEEYPINGTENGWEYFWEQPSEYTLDEVYQSKNVVLSIRNTIDTEFMPPCKYPWPFQKTAEDCAKMCPKYDQLISFNETTAQHIAQEEKLLFPQGARILGVSIRGTDYGSSEYTAHPIQASVCDLIIDIKKRMRQWDMDYVFLACESDAVIDMIRNKIGDKLLVLPRSRYKNRTAPQDDEHNPLYKQGHRYQTNLDYVTEMALLSRCNSLLASMSGGVRIAIIWNAMRYEKMEIIDNGVW